MQSADLGVTLVSILSAGQEPTLVEDPGWVEFIIDIENRSRWSLAVKNVKLLNADGRYVDSASSYAQIIAPPDPGEQVAGHVARNAAGIAVGQVIPFGGLLTSTIFTAASAYGVGAKTTSKRAFYLRVLKNVELAPGGKVSGSAFLPDIPDGRRLIVDYVMESGETSRSKSRCRCKALKFEAYLGL